MIPSKAQARIDKIHAKSKEERAAIADLNSKVKDLKQLLVEATHRLDDVDVFFLGPDAMRQQRDDHQWSYWLQNAERALRIAIERREYVAGLVAKFGADARVIGG